MNDRFGNMIPPMPGVATMAGDEERVAITLVCLFCSKEQQIHVPRRVISLDRVFWECFSCQAIKSRPLPIQRRRMQRADKESRRIGGAEKGRKRGD